jgi:hypothetical protein
LCLRTVEQRFVGGTVAGVAAQQPMLAEDPQIARSGDGNPGATSGHLIFWCRCLLGRLTRLVQDAVDFGDLKAGQFQVELEIDQPLEFGTTR